MFYFILHEHVKKPTVFNISFSGCGIIIVFGFQILDEVEG